MVRSSSPKGIFKKHWGINKFFPGKKSWENHWVESLKTAFTIKLNVFSILSLTDSCIFSTLFQTSWLHLIDLLAKVLKRQLKKRQCLSLPLLLSPAGYKFHNGISCHSQKLPLLHTCSRVHLPDLLRFLPLLLDLRSLPKIHINIKLKKQFHSSHIHH